MEHILAIIMGIGLAAACGFRVFVPLLITAIAVRAGHAHVSPSFAWVGSDPALIALGLAMVIEIVAYYVPFLGHLLDVLATPAAVVAGTLVAASFITDMSPMMRWMLAAIAGGGAAGLIQTATVALRAVSTATTAGLGNPIIATFEVISSFVLALVAVLLPVGVVVMAVLLAVAMFLLARRLMRRRVMAGAAS